jgi:hypothetical protein
MASGARSRRTGATTMRSRRPGAPSAIRTGSTSPWRTSSTWPTWTPSAGRPPHQTRPATQPIRPPRSSRRGRRRRRRPAATTPRPHPNPVGHSRCPDGTHCPRSSGHTSSYRLQHLRLRHHSRHRRHTCSRPYSLLHKRSRLRFRNRRSRSRCHRCTRPCRRNRHGLRSQRSRVSCRRGRRRRISCGTQARCRRNRRSPRPWRQERKRFCQRTTRLCGPAGLGRLSAGFPRRWRWSSPRVHS